MPWTATFFLFSFLIGGPFLFPPAARAETQLVIEIEEKELPKGGELLLFFYETEESWRKEEADQALGPFPFDQVRKEGLTLTELPPKTYLIVGVHDMNRSGDIDRDPILGLLPTEPFAISGIQKMLFKSPDWDEANFELKPNESHHLRLLFKYH